MARSLLVPCHFTNRSPRKELLPALGASVPVPKQQHPSIKCEHRHTTLSTQLRCARKALRQYNKFQRKHGHLARRSRGQRSSPSFYSPCCWRQWLTQVRVSWYRFGRKFCLPCLYSTTPKLIRACRLPLLYSTCRGQCALDTPC